MLSKEEISQGKKSDMVGFEWKQEKRSSNQWFPF